MPKPCASPLKHCPRDINLDYERLVYNIVCRCLQPLRGKDIDRIVHSRTYYEAAGVAFDSKSRSAWSASILSICSSRGMSSSPWPDKSAATLPLALFRPIL